MGSRREGLKQNNNEGRSLDNSCDIALESSQSSK